MDLNPAIELYGGPILRSGEQQTAFAPTQACLIALAYLEPKGSLTRERVSWLLWEEAAKERQCHRIRQLVYAINGRAARRVLVREGEAILPVLPSDVAEMQPSAEPPLARVTAIPTAAFEQWQDLAVKRMEQERTLRMLNALDSAARTRSLAEVLSVSRTLTKLGKGGAGPALDLAWALTETGGWRAAEETLRIALAASIPGPDRDRLQRALAWITRGVSRGAAEGGLARSAELLLGRKRLLAEVARAIRAPLGPTVVLFGIAGIGKTSVMSSVTREYRLRFPERPLLVAQARSRQSGVFSLWEALLQAGWVERALRRNLELFSPDLARALPRLAEATDLRESAAPHAGAFPGQLAVSMGRLLKAIHGDRLGLLVIDDIDAADRASLELLREVDANTARPSRRLVSITAGSAEDARTKARSFLGDYDAELIEVPELENDFAIKLVQGHAGATLNHNEVRSLVRALGGVPAYLVEAAAAGSTHRAVLPRSTAAIANERIGRLDALERFICSTIAVAGTSLGASALSRISEVSPARVSLALERLIGRGLLARTEEGISFRHRFLETAAYERLSKQERTALHAEVLSALLDNTSSTAPVLRRHAARAGGDSSRLAQQLMRQAAQAESKGALAEAARQYRYVAGCLAKPSEAARATLRASENLVRLRRHDEALDLLKRTLRQMTGQHSEIPALRLRLQQTVVEGLTEPRTVLREDLQELLGALREKGLSIELSRALDAALSIADAQNDVAWASELLEMADQANPVPAEAKTWIELARTRHLYLGTPRFGMAAAQSAVEWAGQADSPAVMSRALNRRIVALVFRGRLGSAAGAEALRSAKDFARATGDVLLLYDTFVNEGSWHMDVGDLDGAAYAFGEAAELLGSDRYHQEHLTMRVNLGELYVHSRRGPEAQAEFEKALEYSGDSGAGRHLCAAGLALAALELGRARDAKEWDAELEDIDPAQRFRGNLSLIGLARSRVAQATGRRREALRHLLEYGSGMLPWMVPAALKLYLEAFRLSIRWEIPLDAQERDPPVHLASKLEIPGNGLRLRELHTKLPR